MSSMNADDPVIAPAETGRYRGDPQPIDHDQILILDFGSQTAQLIARRVREQNVFCRMVRHDLSAERIRDEGLAPEADARGRARQALLSDTVDRRDETAVGDGV